MIALLLQGIMGFGFGWLISNDPEDVVWKKLGLVCALQAVFLTASLQQSGADALERMALIVLLIIPFLWGVTEGASRRFPKTRKKRK